MYGTIIQQGTFTAVAAPTILNIRSGIDWIKVYDPASANAAAAVGFEYFWQLGMAPGTGAINFHAAASTVVNSGFLVAPLGFTLINTSTFPILSAPIAVAAGTNAVQPQYTSALAGVAVGSIVRIYGTAHTNLNGLDFSVGASNPGVTFDLRGPLATAPGAVAGALGFAVLVANSLAEYNLYYPSTRVICNITQNIPGVNAVTTLVDHGLTTGQQIRINVPRVNGINSMYELDGQLATVTVTGVNTFSINIDTTGYTAFVFPPAVAGAFVLGSYSNATMTPLGGEGLSSPNLLLTVAATDDKNYLGIKLGYDPAGTGLAPAGIAGHTMYWIAGKSENV